MGADEQHSQPQNSPRTPEEFGEWFADASDEQRREFADFHGDATAGNRAHK